MLSFSRNALSKLGFSKHEISILFEKNLNSNRYSDIQIFLIKTNYLILLINPSLQLRPMYYSNKTIRINSCF